MLNYKAAIICTRKSLSTEKGFFSLPTTQEAKVNMLHYNFGGDAIC